MKPEDFFFEEKRDFENQENLHPTVYVDWNTLTPEEQKKKNDAYAARIERTLLNRLSHNLTTTKRDEPTI